MAEGLGRLFLRRRQQGKLLGIRVGDEVLTHLQFVDDTSLVGVASFREARMIRDTLNVYLKATQQVINDKKSKVVFFNLEQRLQDRILEILGFTRTSLPVVYLGVPLHFKKLKLDIWRNLLECIKDRINHWSHKRLSYGGRLTFLQSVIQAMPIYKFSILVAPITIWKELDRMARKFLWEGAKGERKWALVGWDKVTQPKVKGGLGLRKSKLNNKALAGKLYWRWISQPTSLFSRILTSKYLGQVNPNDVARIPLDGTGSLVWQALKLGSQVVKDYLF